MKKSKLERLQRNPDLTYIREADEERDYDYLDYGNHFRAKDMIVTAIYSIFPTSLVFICFKDRFITFEDKFMFITLTYTFWFMFHCVLDRCHRLEGEVYVLSKKINELKRKVYELDCKQQDNH